MSMFRGSMLAGMAAVCCMGLAFSQSQAQIPGYPPYPVYPPYPSFPIYQSPTTITGLNPGGGLNTAGQTVNNTALDPYRNLSMGNGSLRPVSRPKFDQFGNIIGWETGTEWNNSVNGQVHSNLQVTTPNSLGGWNQQSVNSFHSGGGYRPSSTRPSGFKPRH